MGRHGVKKAAATAVAICSLAFAPCICAYAATSADGEAAVIEWQADMDCTATCHTRQVETLQDEEAQIYASHASLTCTMCHTDVEGMAEGHEDVTEDDTEGPKRLKKSEVTSDGCLTCHEVTDGTVSEGAWAASEGEGAEAASEQDAVDADEADTDEADADTTDADTTGTDVESDEGGLAIPAYSSSATADVTCLTDENGTTVNPHDLPVNESHDTITCATCHTMHDDDSIEETAVAACKRCHHDNVYECYTCHD